MRMTLVTALVLQAIARGYRFGLQIVDVTGHPTGAVYPALRRLEHAGFVRSEWEHDAAASKEARPQRRYYRDFADGASQYSSDDGFADFGDTDDIQRGAR